MSKSLYTITHTEASKLLTTLLCESPSQVRTNKGIRNYTMALLMLDAGLRVGEVAKLYQTDFLFQGAIKESLVLSGGITKRGRERTVPLSSRIQKALILMEKKIWTTTHGPESFYAFFNSDATARLTTRQVQRVIKTASLQAFGRAIHPHILRHTFATNLMRTCSIRIVQELLGHKNLSSTQVYTHPGMDDLKNAIEGISSVDFINNVN